MALIRMLTSVAGIDFSWVPGDELDMDDTEAEKWADGIRAERVTPTKTRKPRGTRSTASTTP